MPARSPGFQAPEQLSGSLIGVESDVHVYAFGAVCTIWCKARVAKIKSVPHYVYCNYKKVAVACSYGPA